MVATERLIICGMVPRLLAVSALGAPPVCSTRQLHGVCVAAERKTGKLDFDIGRPDALETRIEVSGYSSLDIERF